MTEKEANEKISIEWESIKKFIPTNLHEGFDNYCYIAGGAIYRLLNDQSPKDYDVFCNDLEFVKVLSDSIAYEIKTSNAITFNEGRYQIILKDIDTMKNVVERFDFLHNFVGWSKKDGIQLFTKEENIRSNVLRFNNARARDIANCICRVPKFVSRGMTITKKQMAIMIKKLLTESNTSDEKHQMDALLHGSGY